MTTKSTTQILVLGVIVVFAAGVGAETNWELQAVDETGHSICPKEGADFLDPNNKVVIEGIVLNNPEDILSTQANYNTTSGNIGGQWQVFIQGTGDDPAGTAVWMGQNYANRKGTGRYTNEAWEAELNRIHFVNGHHIRQGDLVRITGFALEYNGKTNINERHDTWEAMDFTVEWLERTPGLPESKVISLAEVKDAADIDLFDVTRMMGGEYYQGQLVRMNNVHYVSGTFAPNEEIIIGDSTKRTLRVKLGLGSNFNTNNLNSTFDIVGIFDQEYGYTDGYRLWVAGYDGGQTVLGILPPVPGDANDDRMVDVGDLGILAANYGRHLKTQGVDSQLWRFYGDFNGDGVVDVGDLGILAANYNTGVQIASDFGLDYSRAMSTSDSNENSEESADEEMDSTICSGLGLGLVIIPLLMGLMLVKLED